MSAITVLAADHEMPLRACEQGFGVAKCDYYGPALSAMELDLKPFQYELGLSHKQESIDALRQYLAECCQPGEKVELWHVWLGPPPEFGWFNRYSTLEELDVLTIYNLLKDDPICLNVTI